MTPAALITLYGNDDPALLGWIETIVATAIANIVGDVTAVSQGREDRRTAILNTIFPFIGKAIGNAVWPVSSSTGETSAPAPAPPKKLSDLPPEIQQIAALVGSGVPFIGSLIYQLKKGFII